MKKYGKTILCIISILFSGLASAIGFGFMGDSSVSFSMKLICGLVFLMPPIFVLQLIIMLNKKDK